MTSQSNIPFQNVTRLANDETGEIVFVVTENGQPKDITGLKFSAGFCADGTVTELIRLNDADLKRPQGTTNQFVIDLTPEQRKQLTAGTTFVAYVFEVRSDERRDPRAYFSYTRLLKPGNFIQGQPVEPAALQLDYDTTTASTALLTVYVLGGGGAGSVGTFTDADRAKLASMAVGATKNDSDANLRKRDSHTGVQAADTITQDSTHRFVTDTQITKLAGVAVGATANATDAQLRNRDTHTGTQPSSTISDFVEAVQDVMGMTLFAGSNVNVNYNDAANTLTISASGGGAGSSDPEAIRDTIGAALIGLGGISVLVNDEADTITITTTATRNDTDANLKYRPNHTGMQAATTITEDSTHRWVTDLQIAAWSAKQDPITAYMIRNYFSAGNGLLYDKANGQYYVNAADINTIIKSFLKSRDGWAVGRVLSATETDFIWIAVTNSGNNPTPTPTPVEGFANPTDATRNRADVSLMTDVTIDTVQQLKDFCATSQTNKRGILTQSLYDLGDSRLEQKGNWLNVRLIADTNVSVVVRSTSSVVFIVTENHTCEKVDIRYVTFQSTNTTSNEYAICYSNELVGFKGLEYAYCRFVGTQRGNYNAFGLAQYSTSSQSGASSQDLYVHHCYFTAPRMGMEILSQGYDSVRLTNVIVTDNTFENTQANPSEAHRMAGSTSGLVTNIYFARNRSINAKDIAFEFVNVKYVLAEDNEATATLEPCVGYSISDDGRNSTESIYIKGGTFNMTSRPFQIYDAKDVHFKGGTYRCGRGIDVNTRGSSFDGLDVQCTNLNNAEPVFQFGGTSNGNKLLNSTLSSWGSAAAGHEPSYETVVYRGPQNGNTGTFNNETKGCVLKQGKRLAGGYFTDGRVVNQGTASPANTESGNTVQLES